MKPEPGAAVKAARVREHGAPEDDGVGNLGVAAACTMHEDMKIHIYCKQGCGSGSEFIFPSGSRGGKLQNNNSKNARKLVIIKILSKMLT